MITGDAKETTLDLTLALTLLGGGAATKMSERRGDTEAERCRSFLIGGDDRDGLRERGGNALLDEHVVLVEAAAVLCIELSFLRANRSQRVATTASTAFSRTKLSEDNERPNASASYPSTSSGGSLLTIVWEKLPAPEELLSPVPDELPWQGGGRN